MQNHVQPTAPGIVNFAKGRCPRCGKGKVFLYGPYSLKFQKMHKSCTECGYDFEPEPGFYYGAMYISYAMTVAIAFAVLVPLYVLSEEVNVPVSIGVLAGVLLVLSPALFRASRLMMLYWFAPKY